MSKHAAPGPGNEIPSPDDIEHQHLSPDVLIGLGNRAVSAHMDQVHDQISLDDEHHGAWYDAEHVENMAEAMGRLESLSGAEKQEINTLLAMQPGSPWLDGEIGVRDTPATYKDYVGAVTRKDRQGDYRIFKRKDFEGENHETGGLFMNFLEWHNAALATAQEKLNETELDRKRNYVLKFHTAIEKGWVDSSAAANLRRLNDARLIVDDGFETTAYGGLGHLHSDHREGIDYIRLAPKEVENTETEPHEFTHVIEGRDDFDPDDYNQLNRPMETTGLQRDLGADIGGVALNEAVVEHFTDSMAHGNIDIIDPSDPIRENAVYTANREFLFTLAEKGLEKVDIRLFLNAMLENGDDTQRLGNESHRARLFAELRNRAFPFANVPREISQLHEVPGKTHDEVITEYAENLAKRAAAYKHLPKKAADVVNARLAPKYEGRHRA